jgi:hypothetical protein
MGWPHVALGFVFYFGKVIRGEAKARTAFGLLALLTLAIWTIHYNYAITGLISTETFWSQIKDGHKLQILFSGRVMQVSRWTGRNVKTTGPARSPWA